MRNYDEPTRSEVITAQTRAVGGGHKRCSKGKSCSATCIDPNEKCLVEFPVPASTSLTRLRDKLSDEDLAFFNKMRDNFKDRRYEEILDAISIGNEGKYNHARQDIIKFNDGRPDNTEGIKVPVTWEKVQRISKAYDNAVDSAFNRIDKARHLGDREKFDREVSKLRGIYEAIGSRLGKSNEAKYVKWDDYKDTKFLKKIYGADLRGAKITYRSPDLIITTKVGKHKVTIELSDSGLSFNFKVNGQYAADPNVTRREGIQIALRVKEIFNKVVSSMKEGSEVTVTPYTGDGKGDARTSMYKAYGFTPDGDSMYGRVSKGKIVGSTESKFNKFVDKDSFNFSAP
jgi:hypothetical protein